MMNPPKPNSTTLNLMAPDGAISVTFSTNLTAEQYDKVHEFVIEMRPKGAD